MVCQASNFNIDSAAATPRLRWEAHALRRRARLRRLLVGSTLLLILASGVAWMCFQYVPSWYQPVWLSRAQTEMVRSRAERTFEQVSSSMVRGEPFSLTLTALQINEILAAQRLIWPAATAGLGRGFTAPCVNIKPDQIKLGLRYRWGQIQSVLSVELWVRNTQSGLVLEAKSAKAGVLPVPLGLLAPSARSTAQASASTRQPAQASPGAEPETLADALDGLLNYGQTVSLSKTFRWPNGDVPFQITELVLNHDSLTLQILPLRGY